MPSTRAIECRWRGCREQVLVISFARQESDLNYLCSNAVFVDVGDGDEQQRKNETSFYNEREALAVLCALDQLVQTIQSLLLRR